MRRCSCVPGPLARAGRPLTENAAVVAQWRRLPTALSYAGSVILFGQHPAPTHLVAHFSDTHFLEENRLLYGAVDTQHGLLRALAQLESSALRPDAIVFTGDLADLGEPEAYRRLRSLVQPIADRLGATLVWAMGNHDERRRFEEELFDRPGTGQPQDRVYDLGGLRMIVLDSSVPGWNHGDIDGGQLQWLAAVLADPAPHGTLIALHHPPIPTPLELMALLELKNQEALAAVIRDTDVRGILAGHLHYSTHGMFAGVPVHVSSATCYTLDPASPHPSLSGYGGGQSFALVHVYADQIVHSTVPIGRFERVSAFSGTFVEKLAALGPTGSLDAFSNKTSTATVEGIEGS